MRRLREGNYGQVRARLSLSLTILFRRFLRRQSELLSFLFAMSPIISLESRRKATKSIPRSTSARAAERDFFSFSLLKRVKVISSEGRGGREGEIYVTGYRDKRGISKTYLTADKKENCGRFFRFLLRALDLHWHEDCLKCGCCDCRLGEVGSTLYVKGDLLLCKRDYLRLFGITGYCAACSKLIPAFEMVMRARTNVYHLDCFACQQCAHR